MTTDSREQMSRFVERADRVERSRYLRRVIEQGGTSVNFNWSREAGGGTITTNHPDEEAVDALILTARMFVQNNDPISFGNMANLDDDAGISSEWKEQIQGVRQSLNGYLYSKSFLNIDGKHYTNWEIFDVFLYGHLAHTNMDKATLYKLWSSNQLGFPIVQQAFHMAVMHLLHAVSRLATLCRMELAGAPIPPLPSSAPASPTA